MQIARSDKIFKTLLWNMSQKLPPGSKRPTIVLLHSFHGECKNQIFRITEDAIRVPQTVSTGEELINWLLSPTAGIVPATEWLAGTRVTAMFCIFDKLIRNKSWNKDMHGHKWTKEQDLLGQAQVDVPHRPRVRAEADSMLERMRQTLLLTKGAEQGTTRKEWSINILFRPEIMDAILKRSLAPLRKHDCLKPLLHYLDGDDDANHPLHEIITQRAMIICREQDHAGPTE